MLRHLRFAVPTAVLTSVMAGVCAVSPYPVLGQEEAPTPRRRAMVEVSAQATTSAEKQEPSQTEQQPVTRAFIDGNGPDWRLLGEADFVNVNCSDDTWTWKENLVSCTGQPVGVIRSQEIIKNFELVVQWRHLRAAGNSGVFVWVTPESLEGLKPGSLPQGIEVQVLDHGYTDQYRQQTGKEPDWFTTNGDVFPTGNSTMKPFPPVAPNGSRSFPSKDLSLGVNQWNHYYIRAINGEVRLWVNGEEVSGGTECNPSQGYLCLESEGSPIEFRDLKIRLLP